MDYKLTLFKVPKATNHFNKNQKVWIVQTTGAMAYEVVGKYRGRGRYVRAWYRYDKKNSIMPEPQEIIVTESFYKKIKGN